MSLEKKRQLPSTEEVQIMASEQRGVEALAGTVLLDRYRLVELRGSGGAAVVYRAEHTIMQKPIAVKILRPELVLRQDFVQRFLTEARTVARLRHEHIVDIVDIGRTENGIVFCVMEYLEGEELGETLEREGAMPWGRARHIVLQVCQALDAAHAAGVVHRDIKPQNCFRIRRGNDPDFIKLLDFGIAKQIDQAQGLTATGVIMGTAEYMSPEQTRGQSVDARADIYSLGVMLFEMLAGRPPFLGETFVDVLFKHAYEAPPKLTVLVPTLHPSIDDVLARMLAKRPADRFSSVAEVTSALLESDRNTFRGVFDQAPLHERPESVLPRSSASHQALGASGRFGSRWVWAIAAVVLVLAVSIAIAARSLIHGDDASTVVASSPSTTSSDAPEPVSPPVRDVEATAPATVLPELGPSKPLPPVPIEEQADATSNPPIAASGEDEPTLITTPADPAPSKSEQDAAREGAKFRAAQKVRWQRELKRLIGDACEVYMAKTITITKLQLGTAAVDASPRKLRDCVLNVIPRGLPADKYKITISPTNPAEGEPHANTADPFK